MSAVRQIAVTAAVVLVAVADTFAGPYDGGGVYGFVDQSGRGVRRDDPNATANPIFAGWADSVVQYSPTNTVSGEWTDTSKALGPVTGSNVDIVSLGDLSANQISLGYEPGQIVLSFAEPIRNGGGYEFVVFENAMVSSYTILQSGTIAGQVFAELGYVDVSSDGENFVRFAGVSLTSEAVGFYGTIDISDVHNLAGKHPNAAGLCMGTGFDLDDLAWRDEVVSGLVDINDIRYVRIVDIPGSGAFADAAVMNIDPESGPEWAAYAENHAVYDAWLTYGSGGFDLEAVGVLHEQVYSADINLDGVVDGVDFGLLASAWGGGFGDSEWIGRCDLDTEGDLVINAMDFAEFASQWLGRESWSIRGDQ